MKVAWVTLAIAVAAALGLLLINLFGDITVTNQQDYTVMKNATEAAMYDAKDEEAAKNGICVCTNKERNNGKFKFDSQNDYHVETIKESGKDCDDLDLIGEGSGQYRYCEKFVGEFKINKEVFAESFVRRFVESVKGDSEYTIDIVDIIEYPPKVSVKVASYDNYQITNSKEATFEASDYKILNQIDGIIEHSKRTEVNDPKKPDVNPVSPPTSTCHGGNTHVVLVVDASSTMGSNRKNVISKTKEFIDNLNKGGIDFGYVIFNDGVKDSKAIGISSDSFTYSTHEDSHVGYGLQCGVRLFGYDTLQPTNCNATPATLKSNANNYLIFIGDGKYYNNDYNLKISGKKDKDTDSLSELKTYLNGFPNLHIFSIGYGDGAVEGKEEYNKMKKISTNGTVYKNKELSETTFGSIYSALLNEIVDTCE